jgi:hypothetical protein
MGHSWAIQIGSGVTNVVIGEAKPDLRGKKLVHKVGYEKTPDGKDTFKVTVNASGHGGARVVHTHRSTTI